MKWKCYKAYIYVKETAHKKKKINILKKKTSNLTKICYNAGGRRSHWLRKECQGVNTVFDVANWFLNREPMTHKKLQKLCYYAQAWSLALKDKPIMNTSFEAWVHGPVSRELYNHYSGSGMLDLKPEAFPKKFTTSELEILESVWETYGEYTGNTLEVLTHNEPPWRNARRNCGPTDRCSNTIGWDDMKSYYRSIYIGKGEAEA